MAAAVCGAQTVHSPDAASLAGNVLSQTALARDAVRLHNQQSALDLVHQAQASVMKIRSRVGNRGEPVLVPVRKTTDELNVTTAQSNLDAARAAIQREDWQAADTALAAVQNLVHITNGQARVPLLLARQDLLLARVRLVEGNPGAAVPPLRKAERSLADFERLDHGTRGQQAEDMRQDMEAMARHIKTDGSLDKIDDWLHTVQQWQPKEKEEFQPPEPWVR
jgi:hypothetical protein